MAEGATAKEFVSQLKALSSPADIERVGRFFRGSAEDGAGDNQIMGVFIGKVFPLAKRFAQASLAEIEKLLSNPFYEVRMGAVAIMDFQARSKSAAPSRRKELFDLYLRRHDRINNWDLVDRAAPHVVGRYLMDQPRDPLYKLARSRNPWERRTAIVSTGYFVRAGELEDTFRLAEILVLDQHDLVQKATGSWLREAGKKDHASLLAFLGKNAARMPRTTLRYAAEKLDADLRARFIKMNK